MEIPGVSNIDFLRIATNARRKAAGQSELDPLEFYAHVMPKVCVPCVCIVKLPCWKLGGSGRVPDFILPECVDAISAPGIPPLPLYLQLEALNMDPAFLNRNVNEGFSGG